MVLSSGASLELRELPDHPQSAPEIGLIELLELQRQTDEISGAELSRRIGVDQSTWSRARRGLDRLGVETVAKAVARYPHLREAGTRYLAESYPRAALVLLAEASELIRGAA